jgi:hypothetical protein
MIKVSFEGFWNGFTPRTIPFFSYLLDNEFIQIEKISPEIIICGDDYKEIEKNSIPRLLFTVENRPFNDWNFKYTISFRRKRKNNFFFLNFFYYPYFQDYITNKKKKELLTLQNKNKNKYINFLYSSPNGNIRNQYLNFLNLNNIQVDSLGLWMNNKKILENRKLTKEENKLNNISQYKYTIAFENSFNHEYISEKIWEPLIVKSIPIYHGGDSVFKIFNKKKIIYVKNKYDFRKSLNRMKEIDINKNLYEDLLNENIFINNNLKQIFAYKNLARKFYQFILKVQKDKSSKVEFKSAKRFLYLYHKFLRKFF